MTTPKSTLSLYCPACHAHWTLRSVTIALARTLLGLWAEHHSAEAHR